MHETTLNITVSLDEEKIPQNIKWQDAQNSSSCKAMLVSFFEREAMDTVKIDLWTKDMQVMEMDKFFYQSLRGMADTYFKATKNKELANEFQKFIHYFGQKTGIIE